MINGNEVSTVPNNIEGVVVIGNPGEVSALVSQVAHDAQKIVGVIVPPNIVGDGIVFYIANNGMPARAGVSTKGHPTRYQSGPWITNDHTTPKPIQDAFDAALDN